MEVLYILFTQILTFKIQDQSLQDLNILLTVMENTYFSILKMPI